jgi:hypothetical protein
MARKDNKECYAQLPLGLTLLAEAMNGRPRVRGLQTDGLRRRRISGISWFLILVLVALF